MRKGTQTKLKKATARKATSNILKRYCLVIVGQKKRLRIDFNDIRPQNWAKEARIENLIGAKSMERTYFG
jgi:hypothetical protein